MDAELRAAVEAQYDAFRAPPPVEVDGCPCCSSPAEIEALVRTPRRELTARQLEFYASSAMLTVGDVADLRHFWPRLAELSLAGELLSDPEVVFSKPRHGGWRDWPRAEQDALLAVAAAQMEALARRGDVLCYGEVDSWVCAFGQFMEDVTILLPPLLRAEAGPAAALLSWHAENADTLANGFWKFAPENAQRVREWFARPEVTAAVERALWLAP